jgi:DUF4097 and DUF4098 domain-containing protein YvlB
MKKFNKVILIIATICLAAGALMATLAVVFNGFDLGTLSTNGTFQQESRSFELTADASIVYEGVAHDLIVERSEGKSVEIEYWYNDQQEYTFNNSDSVLRIAEKYKFRLFSFNFDFTNRTTILRIPATFDGSLTLTTSSGAVKLRGLASLEELTLESISGSLELESVEVTGALRATSSSGGVLFSNVEAARGFLNSISGNIRLSDARLTSKLEASSTNGNIRFEGLRVPHVALESISGNIQGDIAGDATSYAIESQTTSGKVSLPDGASRSVQTDNSLAVKTTSGDIVIDFVKAR